MEIKKPYERHDYPGLICTGKSKVQQHFASDVDINNIMAKAVKTGYLPQTEPGFYGDFRNIGDYQTTQNKLIQAQEAFDALPARIRSRFKNEPGMLIDFVNNPENKAEAMAIGLLKMPEAPAVEKLETAVKAQVNT